MKQKLCVYRVYLSKVITQYIFKQQESLGTRYTEKKRILSVPQKPFLNYLLPHYHPHAITSHGNFAWFCIPYKWNLLCMTSFSQHLCGIHTCFCTKLQFIHVHCCIVFNHINIVYFSTLSQMDTWYFLDSGHYEHFCAHS